MKLQAASRLTLVIVLAISLLMGTQLPRIDFNYDFERFYPQNHPETRFYEQFKEQFGSDNDYFLIGLKNNAGIFQKPFLTDIQSLTDTLAQYSDIEQVISPTNVRELTRNRYSSVIIERPWLHLGEESRYESDSTRIYNSKLVNYIFSDDRQSVAIVVNHRSNLSEASYEQLINFVKGQVDDHHFEEAHYAGKCFGQQYFITLIKKETGIFVATSLLLVMLFLWLSYRSLWGIYLPITVVALTVLWTLGTMTLLGKSLDIISNIIPTILLVIGISDVVHLLTHYLMELRAGQSRWSALRYSIKTVGRATLLTTLTTAIGFLTLTSSSFISLVELGIFSTIGLLIAFLLTYTFLPAALILHPHIKQQPSFQNPFWELQLTRLYLWVMKHPRTITGISAGFLLLGIIGASQIRINNYLLDDLRADDPKRVDFEFFAENFSGARKFDCVVSLKNDQENIFDLPVLKELEVVGNYLKEEYGISKLLTPAELMQGANKAYHFSQKQYQKLPEDQNTVGRLLRKMERFTEKYQLNTLIAADTTTARITGYIPDWGSYKIHQKNQAFSAFLESELPDRKLTYQITGAAHLMDLNNRYLAQNIIYGLIVALIIIAGLFAYLFQSAKLVLITLVPNILPLIIIAGIMGFAGIDLKISTSIIFIIAFGIAVDDSIHFLSRFKKEMEGKNVEEAIYFTFLTSGKAIVITSFILMAGFLTLCLSNFLGTFYIGLLVAVTLATALLADLTILPALLLLLLGKQSRGIASKSGYKFTSTSQKEEIHWQKAIESK